MKITRTFRYGAHVFANNIRQHYLRYGGSEAGPPLIVVPGITSPAATWGFVGERLGERFDAYIVDVRGRGLSSSGPGLDYSLDTYAKDVCAFAQTLNLGPYIVVGHSMGGRIAIRAACADHQIQRLVIIDPPLTGPGRSPSRNPVERYLTAIALARRGASLEELRPFTPTFPEEHLRMRAEWLHTCDETAVAKTHQGFQTDDIHADLAAVQHRAVFMAAGKGLVSPEALNEIRQIAPLMPVRVVPNAGHMIPMEDLEGFMQAFDDLIPIGHAAIS